MKPRINRNNYEEFFMDYLDGNLSESEIIMMEDFLAQNPDLRNELEGLEGTFLSPEDITFPGKDMLRQIDTASPVTEENFEDYCIAEAEGDLNEEQIRSLNAFIAQHPALAKERKVYQKLKLIPEEGISYPGKASLKKSFLVVHRRQIYAMTAMAAGIALMIALFLSFPANNNPDPSSGISMVEEDKKEKAETDGKEEAATDSTAIKSKTPSGQDEEAPKEPLKKRINSKIKSATDISFKVTVPIAANEENAESSVMDEKEKKMILKNARINKEEFNRSLAYFDAPQEEHSIRAPQDPVYSEPKIRLSNPAEILALEDYARQKFSTFVFGEAEEEKDLTLWSVASAGIQKLNSWVGSNVKLERAVNEEGETEGISFDAGIFSISTPVNRNK